MAIRLLQRIGQGAASEVPTEESVREYLQELLNTPQGGKGTCPDFGLPTAVQITRPETLPERALMPMVEQIKTCVTKYEPRLRQFQFTCHEGDGKTCRFKARLFHHDNRLNDGAIVNILMEIGELGSIKVKLVG